MESLHLVQCADVGAGVRGGREIRVVERVLGAVVAADVAFAAQHAGEPLRAVDVAVRGRGTSPIDGRPSRSGSERDRERGAHRAQPGAMRGLLERDGLGRVGVRIRDGPHHRFDAVVVRVEVFAADRPVLVPAAGQRRVVHEPLRILPQQHVRVDQRSASQAARDHPLEPAEAPRLEEAVERVGGRPEVLTELAGGAGEAAGRVRTAAFHEHDRLPRFREPVGGDGPAEAAADDKDVDTLLARRIHPDVPLRPLTVSRTL